MMLTYALGGSRAWKCWMISFFAFTLDPILSYQCVCVGLQTSSTRPWDVLGLVISESSAEEKKREAESARDLKNRAHETVLSQLLSAATVMFHHCCRVLDFQFPFNMCVYFCISSGCLLLAFLFLFTRGRLLHWSAISAVCVRSIHTR